MVVEWVRGRGGVRVVRLEEGLLASLDVGTGGRKSNKLESNSRSDGSVAGRWETCKAENTVAFVAIFELTMDMGKWRMGLLI